MAEKESRKREGMHYNKEEKEYNTNTIMSLFQKGVLLDGNIRRDFIAQLLDIKVSTFRRGIETFHPGQKTFLEALSIPEDVVEELKKNPSNIDPLKEVMNQLHDYRCEMLKMPVNEAGFACRLIQSCRGDLPDAEFSELLGEFAQRLIEMKWKQLKCALERPEEDNIICQMSSYYSTIGQNTYEVTLGFPEWVWRGCDIRPEYRLEVVVSDEPGSAEWIDEVTQALEWLIRDELPETSDAVMHQRQQLLLEGLSYQTGIDWGDFICQDCLEDQISMRRLLLMGWLLAEGRTEEALRAREDDGFAKSLYPAYGLDEII